MHLIQILLPLYDNDGIKFPASEINDIRNKLMQQFGGVTVYRRSPAEGLWNDEKGEVTRDEIIILEVMCEQVDKNWWTTFKQNLEATLKQEKVLIRRTECEEL